MHNNNKKLLLHLSLIKHIGPATIIKLLQTQQANCNKSNALYSYNENDFIEQFAISKNTATLLVQGLANKKILDHELTLIEKYNISFVTLFDENYPELLTQIYLPPPILYCKGTPLRKTAKRLAIVGSRNADHYAKTSTNKIIPPLLANNWEIVSGGAIGVDRMAHENTIEHNGTTIAIFGSGLLKPYPITNKSLFRTILQNNGTIVSPFPLLTTPNKGNFPARNRIIAGLSNGCIVMQAAKKSGALITAQFALDQGKQIFALPGAIDNPLSYGCHTLIQDGAKLVTNGNDILEEFGETAQESTPPSKKEKTSPQNEHPILSLLKTPLSLDELCMKSGTSLIELQNQLFSLQLQGKIYQNFAGLWERS